MELIKLLLQMTPSTDEEPQGFQLCKGSANFAVRVEYFSTLSCRIQAKLLLELGWAQTEGLGIPGFGMRCRAEASRTNGEAHKQSSNNF